jgi:tetratricopeptide (TPR) repeat protein
MSDSAPHGAADREPAEPSHRRRLGWLLPVLPVVAGVAAFAFYLTRDDPPPDETAVAEVDVTDVPTERLDGVLASLRAADPDSEQVPGVALVLAERYFSAGSYDRAFELYAEIVEHPATASRQFAVALSRIGWIAWRTTGDAEAALTTLDQALSVDPANSEAYYIRGQILWCGLGDPSGAVVEFERVLTASDLTPAVEAQVAGDLDAIAAGETCA